jgi:hypothetical protein
MWPSVMKPKRAGTSPRHGRRRTSFDVSTHMAGPPAETIVIHGRPPVSIRLLPIFVTSRAHLSVRSEEAAELLRTTWMGAKRLHVPPILRD